MISFTMMEPRADDEQSAVTVPSVSVSDPEGGRQAETWRQAWLGQTMFESLIFRALGSARDFLRDRPVYGRVPLVIGLFARIFHPGRAAAEDHVEYRYEGYSEENDRIQVRTHAIGFDAELGSRITARGLLVYDGLSGATPTGEAPPVGSNDLPMVVIADIRRAASLSLEVRSGRHTTTPGLNYSEESDYISRGLSLTHAIDFNQKNTTLVLGVAHNFDSVGGGSLREFQDKGTTDWMVGVNQLLGPKTVLSVNASMGYGDGYLNDPYRRATFVLEGSPDPIFSDPGSVNPLSESRPGHRFKQTAYASLTQYIALLNASVEGGYRLYHDDWGVWANTIDLTWHQKIGKYLTLSPLFRYHRQSAADFYATRFSGVSFDAYTDGTRVAFEDGIFVGFQGDPSFPTPEQESGFQIIDVPARQSYYSADYRLSEFEAFTFGVGAHVKLGERFSVDLAYKRYEMRGLDALTPRASYPSANVISLGCAFWF